MVVWSRESWGHNNTSGRKPTASTQGCEPSSEMTRKGSLPEHCVRKKIRLSERVIYIVNASILVILTSEASH
jgi:hypothetical protein